MILVTGGSGHIGSRVASCLVDRGLDVTALVRDADKASRALCSSVPVRVANYNCPDQLGTAFSGVDELVLIPSDEPADVLRKHVTNLVDAAREACVRRVVFLGITDLQGEPSFYYAGGYREAEAVISRTFKEWVILRCGLHADLVADHWIRPVAHGGAIELPAANGRLALISRETVATAVAAAAFDRALCGQVMMLTGPAALSFGDVAREAAALFRSSVAYRSCRMAEYVGRLERDLETPWPEAFASLITSIRLGRYAAVTADVERLTGQLPEMFHSFLRRWASVGPARTG